MVVFCVGLREVQQVCLSAPRHVLLEISPSLTIVEAKGRH